MAQDDVRLKLKIARFNVRIKGLMRNTVIYNGDLTGGAIDEKLIITGGVNPASIYATSMNTAVIKDYANATLGDLTAKTLEEMIIIEK